jgi:hypothetical protein
MPRAVQFEPNLPNSSQEVTLHTDTRIAVCRTFLQPLSQE